MILLTLLFFLSLFNEIINIEDFILVHPERQISREGSTVTLQCRVKVLDKLEVHWVKDGFGLGNSKNDIRQYGKPINNKFRYDLPFNLHEGKYDLKITNLDLSDEGVFYCQMIVDGVSHSSKKAVVQVLVPSHEPKLIQRCNQGLGPKEEKSHVIPIIVNDGEDLVIDCIAKNGRPGAKLYWFINDLNIKAQSNGGINGTVSGKITLSVTPSSQHIKLYNSKSTLTLKINNLRNENWLKCVAENQGFELQKLNSAMSRIEVHTIPIVKMEANPNRKKNEYIENDVVEFSCTADGRPKKFSWKWYVNGKKVENIIVNKYTIKLNRSINNSSLKCVAVSTREGFDSMNIIMQYGPKFLNQNTIMYAASLGETVAMTCKVDSNPEAVISWQRESSTEIIYKGIELMRKNIQEEDFGMYRCTAVANGFSSVFKNSYLAKKKPPLIIEPSVSYGREGQTVRLTCLIESVPLPKDKEIKWIFRNKIISKSNRHKSYQETFIGGIVSGLQILSLNADDFGDYNCTVSTSLGSSTRRVILLPKGETPIFLIVGGSIIFLFILLVITIVLCICKKKKYKNNYEKGNASSPEIPVNHDAKSTLIDSDCHCNPNLYSWIPQTLDLKENRGLLNKVNNQDGSLWSKAGDMNSAYPSTLHGGYTNDKAMEIIKHDNIRANPIIYNIPSNTLDTGNFPKYSSNIPFATLSISRNPKNLLCDQSQCPHYMYQEFNPNYNVQIPANHNNNDTPSPVYLMKNPQLLKQQQFSFDYYSTAKPLNNPQTNFLSENSNNKFVPEYASNI